MKIWKNFGSEHSMNLVMIGHFGTPADANGALDVIEQIGDQVGKENLVRTENPRYSEEMLKLLGKLKIHSMAPYELEQLAYDFSHSIRDSDLILKTDEADISAFLKILIDLGARVEVYSAHDHPGTGFGRGESR